MGGPYLTEDWLKSLEKRLSKATESLADEVESLAMQFGDAVELAHCYIIPTCRLRSATPEAGKNARHPPVSVADAINAFLDSDPAATEIDRNGLLVLAEAGMGKTSLLFMLKLAHAAGFWPPGQDCALLAIDEDSLEAIAAIEHPESTILLLDGLDEDPKVGPDQATKRMEALMSAAEGFRRVIVSCSNRFYLRHVESPRREDEALTFASRPFAQLLLMGFDDERVEAYLQKRYRSQWYRPRSSSFSLAEAQAAAAELGLLRYRPLLLAHLQDLQAQAEGPLDEYKAFGAIVIQWLIRVAADPANSSVPGLSIESLYETLKSMATRLSASDQKWIPENVLSEAGDGEALLLSSLQLGERSIVSCILDASGAVYLRFAHLAIQEFLVAQTVLEASSPDEIIAPAYATETLVDLIAKGRDSEEEHRGKRIVLKHLKRKALSAANLRGAIFGGADFAVAVATGARYDKALPGQPFTFILGPECAIELVWISPGSMRMGDDRSDLKVVFDYGFWMGRHPVTQRQYLSLMEINPAHFVAAGPEAPVEQVSWDEAQQFCRKLTELIADKQDGGYHFRLPKEAEWEYACRAGSRSRYCYGDDEGQLHRYAWYSGNSEGRTHEVGRRLPNAWGLHDMHGNVWEWCDDWCLDFAKTTITDMQRSEDREDRVIRGGSFSNGSLTCRASNRNWYLPAARYNYLGFRVALVREPGLSTDPKRLIGL